MRCFRMSNNQHEANSCIHTFIIPMESTLYKLRRPWFQKLVIGPLLTCSTVSSWIRTVDEKRRFRKFYHHLSRLGIQIDAVQCLFHELYRLENGLTWKKAPYMAYIKCVTIFVCLCRHFIYSQLPNSVRFTHCMTGTLNFHHTHHQGPLRPTKPVMECACPRSR